LTLANAPAHLEKGKFRDNSRTSVSCKPGDVALQSPGLKSETWGALNLITQTWAIGPRRSPPGESGESGD
jgi:hypothetical protein